MALDTVQDYIDRARVLLLDGVVPYRYSTDELVEGLNLGLLEVRRLRPEIVSPYFSTAIPEFSSADMSAAVPIDQQYRVAFVYYICGHAQMRDDEVNQDTRASAFLNKFIAQLLTIQA